MIRLVFIAAFLMLATCGVDGAPTKPGAQESQSEG